METLVSHTLYYYWNPIMKEKDGLLDTISPSFYEIDLGDFLTLKVVELWAIALKKWYHFVRCINSRVLALTWRLKDIKAETGDLRISKSKVKNNKI